jgi:hypothetical protein
MFDHDSLYISLYKILAEELPDARYSEVVRLANKLGEEAVKRMPKQGDFWLTPEGKLYVNHGWHEVTPEGVSPEGLQSIAKNDTFKGLTI